MSISRKDIERNKRVLEEVKRDIKERDGFLSSEIRDEEGDEINE
jgi:hypothetical protein